MVNEHDDLVDRSIAREVGLSVSPVSRQILRSDPPMGARSARAASSMHSDAPEGSPGPASLRR